RERREKCLGKNAADRQQKKREHKFHPPRRDCQLLRWLDEASRSCARNASNNFLAALGIARVAILFRSALRSSQSLPQITQPYRNKRKTEPQIARPPGMIAEQAHLPAVASAKAGRLPAPDNRSGCRTVNSVSRLRAAHVGTGAGVDLDGFAFLDEKRDVDGLAGFELCRLGDVAGGIAANALG